MKVVSENSEADIARNEALAQVEWRLRDLAANILRVVRGAGKSYDLGPQAVEVVTALVAYKDAAGYYPSTHELDRALDITPDAELLDGISDDESEKLHAERKMIRGALQIAASRLLVQRTQETAGRNELYRASGQWRFAGRGAARRISQQRARQPPRSPGRPYVGAVRWPNPRSRRADSAPLCQ